METNLTNVETPKAKAGFMSVVQNPQGAIGYIFAWILGVPASVLLVIFLLRGH